MTTLCNDVTHVTQSSAVARWQGVQGISDIITIPGLVNVDFADVKAIMCNSGTAMLGVGVSSGKNRAEEAALVRFRRSNKHLDCQNAHSKFPATKDQT